MTHVQWDFNAMSPIVDGKIVDPQTGEIKPAGTPTWSGPPGVEATWHNLSTENQNAFRTIGMPKVQEHVAEVSRVTACNAKLVGNGTEEEITSFSWKVKC